METKNKKELSSDETVAINNNKQKKNINESKTDLPDVKTNAQTSVTGSSMKKKI